MSNWQSIWDKEAKAYYYWNSVTDETTWDEPKEIKESAEQPAKPGPSAVATTEESELTEEQKKQLQDYYNSKEYYDWYMENVTKQAQSAATAQFASYKKQDYTDLATNPLFDSSVNLNLHTKAFNQMNAYFDTEQYQRERAADRAAGKTKKKLSTKEIQKFKKQKIEKKRASLIARMGVD